MSATREKSGSPKQEIREAVRAVPIKKGGAFSDVLDYLEKILKDAKDGKRELPSLRQASFEAAERHGLSGNSTYGRLVSNSARMGMNSEDSRRAKSLRDEWMQFETSCGRKRGGNWGNKSVFPKVLDDMELILSEAKAGKRGLPSLRQAAFEAAERHGLSGNSTYGRLILKAHRTDMNKEVAERAKKLRDEWIALEKERGEYRGGKRSRNQHPKKEEAQEDTSKFEASLWMKQREWAREELVRMFSSSSGGLVWFNMALGRQERKQLAQWLDANTTEGERAQFHPRFVEIANSEYGMGWIGRKPGKAPAKKAKGQVSYKGYDTEEQEE